MEAIGAFLTVVLGLFLRLGVPVAITVLMIGLLRRLDDRWQHEGEILPLTPVRTTPCWEVKNCPEGEKAKCRACANPGTPCWQLFRSKNGLLQERCIGCEIFRTAPVPVASR